MFSVLTILFTTFQGGIAGSSYSIFDLALELKARGHEVHFAGRKEMPLFQWMLESEVQCHDIRFSGYLDFRSATQLHGIVKSWKIEVINAQSGIDRTVCIWSRVLYGNAARLLLTRRQQPLDEPWIKRWLHTRFSDGIVCTSRAIHADLVKKGYPESKLTIIPNGLSQNLINSKRSEFKSSFLKRNGISGPVIGCVSRRKKQDLLIDAIKFLPAHCFYLFVGIDRKDVALVEGFESRCYFTGRIPREEAIKYYEFMDVNLLLSEAEGFGMTILESMKLGVPVIASAVGGARELVRNGENGYLIENTINQLVRALQKIVNETEQNQAMIKQGFETAAGFSIQLTGERFEHYLKNLLG